jgi:hypothetical protein
MLGPWHNQDQDSREHDEQATSQGVGMGDAIDRRPYRGGGMLQSASRSDSIMHYYPAVSKVGECSAAGRAFFLP